MATANAAEIARKARLATGLTQREFARLIGANHITVSKWETGARCPSQVALSLLHLLATGSEECMHTLGAIERGKRRRRGTRSSRASSRRRRSA